MRRRTRTEKQRFPLYDSNTSHPRIIRRISLRDADELVRQQLAVRIELSDGTVVYQRIDPVAAVVMPTRPTMAVLSRAEVDAIAGRNFKGGENLKGEYGPPGRSRTIGMNDLQRDARIAKGLPAEDTVERAAAKLRAWSNLRHELPA